MILIGQKNHVLIHTNAEEELKDSFLRLQNPLKNQSRWLLTTRKHIYQSTMPPKLGRKTEKVHFYWWQRWVRKLLVPMGIYTWKLMTKAVIQTERPWIWNLEWRQMDSMSAGWRYYLPRQSQIDSGCYPQGLQFLGVWRWCQRNENIPEYSKKHYSHSLLTSNVQICTDVNSGEAGNSV